TTRGRRITTRCRRITARWRRIATREPRITTRIDAIVLRLGTLLARPRRRGPAIPSASQRRTVVDDLLERTHWADVGVAFGLPHHPPPDEFVAHHRRQRAVALDLRKQQSMEYLELLHLSRVGIGDES